jgi:phospholipase/carboxylesterase
MHVPGPLHRGQPVISRGVPLGASDAVVVLIHGRGQSPAWMFDVVARMPALPVTWLAPTAAGGSWYPGGFMAPLEENQPHLDDALAALDDVLTGTVAAGCPRCRVVLVGFSQGACLAAEYALRHPARYGGLVLWTGGAIGPPGTTWAGPATFAGTPAFLGSSDDDDWAPEPRIRETAAVLSSRGADVEVAIYPGMAHEVNDAEVARAVSIIRGVLTACQPTVGDGVGQRGSTA